MLFPILLRTSLLLLISISNSRFVCAKDQNNFQKKSAVTFANEYKHGQFSRQTKKEQAKHPKKKKHGKKGGEKKKNPKKKKGGSYINQINQEQAFKRWADGTVVVAKEKEESSKSLLDPSLLLSASSFLSPSLSKGLPSPAQVPAKATSPSSTPMPMSILAEKFDSVKAALNRISTVQPLGSTYLFIGGTPSPTQMSTMISVKEGMSNVTAVKSSIECSNISIRNTTSLVVSYVYQVESSLKLEQSDLLPLQNQMLYDVGKRILNCTNVTDTPASFDIVVGINSYPNDEINGGEPCRSTFYTNGNCTLVNGYMTVTIVTSNKDSINSSVSAALGILNDLMNSGRYNSTPGAAEIRLVRPITEPSEMVLSNKTGLPTSLNNATIAYSATWLSPWQIGLILAAAAALLFFITLVLLMNMKKVENKAIFGASGKEYVECNEGDESSNTSDSNADEINSDKPFDEKQMEDDEEAVGQIPFDEKLRRQPSALWAPGEDQAHSTASEQTKQVTNVEGSDLSEI